MLLTKLSGIHPYEKCIKYPGGHARQHVFMACSKLEARGHLLHKTGTPHKHFSRECNSEEEHDAVQYGIIPEPPEVTEDSFKTANDDDLTPEEKKEAEAAAKTKREAEEKKETANSGKSQSNKPK